MESMRRDYVRLQRRDLLCGGGNIFFVPRGNKTCMICTTMIYFAITSYISKCQKRGVFGRIAEGLSGAMSDQQGPSFLMGDTYMP